MKKTEVCSWIAFCRKTKTKAEPQFWEISRLFPENSTKLYFYEFYLRAQPQIFAENLFFMHSVLIYLAWSQAPGNANPQHHVLYKK